MSRKGLSLRFRLAECRCGEQRIYSQPCANCRRPAPATEIDSELQRRQQLVARTREAFTEFVLPPELDQASQLEALGLLLEQLEHAVGSLIPLARSALAGRGQDGFDEFAGQAKVLHFLSETCVALTELRPARALRAPLEKLAEELGVFVEAVLGALDATTIEATQHYSKRVQPALDDASDAVVEVGALVDAWRLVQESPEPVTTLIQVAARGASGANLLELDKFGRDEVADRLPGAPVPDEHGVLVSLLSSQAAILYDQESFWAAASWGYQLVASNEESLRALLDEADWDARWSRAIAQAFWASEQVGATLEAARHEDAVVRAVLGACHELQEGLSKSVLSSIRFVARPNEPHKRLLAGGTASLAEWAKAKGLRSAAAFDIPSRNAFAHNDWSTDASDIVLCELKPPPGGPVRLTPEELVDHSLAIQEATLGAFLGFVLAAGQCGVALPEDHDLAANSAVHFAKAVLVAGGWSECDVEVGDTVVVRAHVPVTASLSDVAPVAEVFKTSTTLEVRAESEVGVHLVEMDLAAFRSWSAETGEDRKSLAFAELLHQTTLNGVPFADAAQVRRIVAGVTCKWVREQANSEGVVDVFKKAREVATACGDNDLLKAVRTAQGWRRSVVVAGKNRPVSELQTYLDWATIEPAVSTTFAPDRADSAG